MLAVAKQRRNFINSKKLSMLLYHYKTFGEDLLPSPIKSIVLLLMCGNSLCCDITSKYIASSEVKKNYLRLLLPS